MYHCHIRFYLVGCGPEILEILRQIPPLEAFTHAFAEGSRPQAEETSRADVIIARLRGPQAQEDLAALRAGKRPEAELILLADGFPSLAGADLTAVQDIWPASMSREELRFRFGRWQRDCKARKDLWQASSFLESTINSVPNLIWYKTKDGVHEKVNDSFCETVGKTKEQVQGQRHAYIWNVDQDDPACIESENEVMRTGKTCVSEETVKAGEGSRLLTTYKSPLYDLDGSVMGTVGVAIDVTRERVFERRIIEKNRTLEAIFTSMDCGILTHTLDGSRILSINRAALEISGYNDMDSLINQGFSFFSNSVVEEDRVRVQELVQGLKAEGDSVGYEYRIRHANGQILHIMGNAKLVLENGELICQRFLLDCTAQKLREEKAKEEDRRRQAELVQALSVDYGVVCSFDLDSGESTILRLEDVDEISFGGLFTEGVPPRESLARYIEEFVFEDDRELLRHTLSAPFLAKELQEKRLLHMNYRAQLRDGIKYFQVKAVRAGSWENRRLVVLGLCSVDDEVRGEMEKNRLLEDALSQANQANKAKSTFLSNMSHDIRTPMNAIVGFTTLAMAHINSKEQVEEYLKKIQTSGNHLLSLINDILDVSRIESGKMQLEEQPCSLPEILHSLRSILQADVRAKQLELQMDTVDVIHEDVCCDKLRLNQVLLNLLGNAVKFTPAGGFVGLRLTEKAGAPTGYAQYEFCVRDTGIGRSPEFAAHIFEPFVREQTSTVSGIQGTGLGMTITKNIVDMMNGLILVDSKEGEGSTFTVSLTLRLLAEAKEIQRIPELEGARTLVVDDDFNTCDSVSYMLQQLGLRAEWTLSGKEAVLRTRQAAMRQDDYRVYIIDWLLPDMNGVEVARRIRQEVGENAPIIVLTSYDWADIEEEATAAGVTAFCGKPLFLSELCKCLQSVTAAGAEKGPESLPSPEHRTGRILLAEDNELNQEIAATILEEAGFTVDIADNGQIAVDMVKQAGPGCYQVVLMDVRMPVMDGYQATKAIRSLEDPALASLPIIAMTANAFEEDRQEALRQGMNGHIAKPINIKTLFETLDRLLP